MEESAQRRERLKAMRMEASQTCNEGGESSTISLLSNPLVGPTVNPNGQVQPLGQSFNYYTNPMAAYSGNKQKTNVSPQISHDYSSIPPRSKTNNTIPSPSLVQPQMNHSPIIPRHGQYQNPNFSYTPNPPQVQGGYPTPGGYHGPHFISRPGQDSGQVRYPSPGPHFRASPNHGSPGPNQGRGQWFGNSMSSDRGRGRGRGRWSGQGGGHVTAEDRPDVFYNKSMVEDPWKFLEPVIWKSQKKPKPWNLSSSNTKKARVSQPSTSTGSQPSLAEILAASFNEAASGESDAGL